MNTADKQIVALLEDIKRLIVLDLIDRGVQGKRVAKVLNIDPAAVSRIVSPKPPKKR
jgi:predicted transcriptional regulator